MTDIWQRITDNYTALSHLPEDRRPDAKKIGKAMLRILPFLKELAEDQGLSLSLSHSTLCFSSRDDGIDLTLIAVSDTEYEIEIYNNDGTLLEQTTTDIQQTLLILNQRFNPQNKNQ